MKRIFPILILAYVAYLVFTTSCANPGMPSGGDKDTIPPVVIKTEPGFNARMFQESEIRLTFNEFVITDELREALVVSPPLEKRPLIRSKSKTLIIDLGDDLRENTTYSLDFKDAIKDNNEKNPLEDFRFSFSTGADFDSLMIGGYVKNAQNLEPVEGALVMLHNLHEIGAFKDSIPNYIAKTDEEGFYIISNIAPGAYRLYAVLDADNSLTYNQELEQIAFVDSLVIPQNLNLPGYDTETNPEDTVSVSTKQQDALETPFFLMLFEEESFNQYLDNNKRDQANMLNLYFSESLSDSFQVELLQPEPSKEPWSYIEYNKTRDSLMIWLTDTVLSQQDTILMAIQYQVADSLNKLVMQHDTLDFFYKKPESTNNRRRRKKDDDKPEPIPHITFKNNLKGQGYDVYRNIVLEAPEPLERFNWDAIQLVQQVDTLEETVEFEMWQDSLSKRKFYIHHPWEFEQTYRLKVDSAAAYNYAGHPSNEINQKFTIQEESHYAKIILAIGGLNEPGIVQLLDNSDEEKVLQEIRIKGDGEIEFPFLEPDKYKIRLVFDRNDNGKWDTGNLDEGLQPERVMYYSKILKLRSNFEVKEGWVLPMVQYEKELIDENKEKAKKKQSQRSGRRNF
ncbi:Ig-like domain-containing protein [Sunxiuqinia elliptica]|uniref:Ig-like domain-containing protein n=1 Tax=Sunxiuqinia elliptica TaxID=655355 RepID=A0A4R6H3S7_9BACT|nr:Ig-like domain-containing protein [Sunxiuqinia elliptica]TDO02732.1 Ig-like domain-containing protein [Sunxiuqinia elliptica]TDO58530.1 Ig-like domain-containing protein [Sunxiuqinia elliptica]